MTDRATTRALMLEAISKAYERAAERSANPNHAALMIDRLLSEAGYRIYKSGKKKREELSSAVAGAAEVVGGVVG
jgi:hypothetical protein